MKKFTDQLTDMIIQTRDTSINHPFIHQLSTGELPLVTFRYYLIQDNHYLTAFNQLHQVIAVHLSLQDGETLRHLGEGEDAARQKMHQEIGLENEELTTTPVAPTAYAYITHMYYQINTYGKEAAVSGLLTCYWLYSEIAQQLIHRRSPRPLYQEFFDSYSAADFTSSTQAMIDIVNRQANAAGQETRQQMKRAFEISCHYEKAFWQMAYTKEQW